ncbi:MAG: endonuclease/exonuclease/phosphatase family protein [Saprospiraceae bacterium]
MKYGFPFRLQRVDQIEWNKPDYRQEKFEEATMVIANFLDSLNSDIYTLTEVGSEEDVKFLQKLLKKKNKEYKYVAVADSQDNATGQNVAIISKYKLKDVVKEIPGREFYISEEDDPEEIYDTGISKGMCATIKVEAYEFIVYVLHFVSERGGQKEDKQRVAQASVARRHMLKFLQEDKKVIITGDLNDHRGQPTLQRIRGLDDIFEDFIQTGSTKYFPEEKLDTRWTHKFRGEFKQIDHILLSLSIKDICKRSGIKAMTHIHRNPEVSDHNAFSVLLKLK